MQRQEGVFSEPLALQTLARHHVVGTTSGKGRGAPGVSDPRPGHCPESHGQVSYKEPQGTAGHPSLTKKTTCTRTCNLFQTYREFKDSTESSHITHPQLPLPLTPDFPLTFTKTEMNTRASAGSPLNSLFNTVQGSEQSQP